MDLNVLVILYSLYSRILKEGIPTFTYPRKRLTPKLTLESIVTLPKYEIKRVSSIRKATSSEGGFNVF